MKTLIFLSFRLSNCNEFYNLSIIQTNIFNVFLSHFYDKHFCNDISDKDKQSR